MKNKNILKIAFFLNCCIIAIVFFAFQTKPKETLIVDGYVGNNCTNREATYYVWDKTKNKTIEIKSRKNLLSNLYNQGYTLKTSYCYVVSYKRYETWIFEK